MNAPVMPWAADSVERVPLSELIPYARNARTHSDEQVDQIVASMLEFGWTIPVLRDEKGEVIAGHGRLLAAERLGYDSAPAMTARGWTAKQIRAYRIADNKLALNSGWDVKLLAAELGELTDMTALIGFGEGDLEALLLADDEGEGGAGRTPPTIEEARQTLAERFGLPPFSVLNAREGWWQERKRAWLALGIESELGRGENLIGRSLQDRVSQTLHIHYSKVVEFVDRLRAEGKSDDEILAEAERQAGTRRSADKGDDTNAANPPNTGKGMAAGLLDKRAAQKAAKRPKAATFMTGAALGGGNFNDQVFAKTEAKKKAKAETEDLRGGLTHRTTPDPYRAADKGKARAFGQDILNSEGAIALKRGQTNRGRKLKRNEEARVEKGAIVAGKGWADGGPARRDAAFYAKKRAWEAANGQKISTKEFREKHWNGAV